MAKINTQTTLGRVLALCIVATLALGFGLLAGGQTVLGQFATNTPAGEAAPETATASEIIAPSASPTPATAGSSGGSLFATNTPLGPTATPTNSPTPTLTPSNTPTATSTPTNTSTPTATNTPTNTPSPTPTPNGPFIYPQGVNPLTGLPYADQEALERRTLIVKVSNFPPLVRPQHGVNAADLVYEYEAEGGVTRFAALFRSNAPERVGSIRSARLLDMELVTMYQALLAYSGTSEPINQLLFDSDFAFQLLSPAIGDNCAEAGFCRFPDEGKAFEHTLFGDTTKMWERAEARGVNTGYIARGFAFSPTPDAGGAATRDVSLDWYGQTDARWQYDAESGQYLRYTDGEAHYDAADGQQLYADNLVILVAPHERRPDLFPPGADYESLEVQLWDQGRAILIRDGQAYQGFWRRQNRNPGSALQLIYGDNTPMMMKPGRTWVSIMRGFGDVSLSAALQDVASSG